MDLDKMPHDTAIKAAMLTLDVNPYYVFYRYIEAVFEEEDFNMVRASKRLNMHRRTMQRILAKKRPAVYRAALD